MKITVLIGTYGDHEWSDLAWSRAFPSAAKQHDRIQVAHDPAGTLASVRNALAAAADDDSWLCFLDADDELDDDYLEAMREAISSKLFSVRYGLSPALFVPAVQYVHDGRRVGQPTIPAWERPLIDLNCAVIGTLISARLFHQVGGFGSEPIYEDWALWLRAVRAGARMVPVPDAVYLADQQPGRNLAADGRPTYDQVRAQHQGAVDWNNVGAYKDLRAA